MKKVSICIVLSGAVIFYFYHVLGVIIFCAGLIIYFLVHIIQKRNYDLTAKKIITQLTTEPENEENDFIYSFWKEDNLERIQNELNKKTWLAVKFIRDYRNGTFHWRMNEIIVQNED